MGVVVSGVIVDVRDMVAIVGDMVCWRVKSGDLDFEAWI